MLQCIRSLTMPCMAQYRCPGQEIASRSVELRTLIALTSLLVQLIITCQNGSMHGGATPQPPAEQPYAWQRSEMQALCKRSLGQGGVTHAAWGSTSLLPCLVLLFRLYG